MTQKTRIIMYEHHIRSLEESGNASDVELASWRTKLAEARAQFDSFAPQCILQPLSTVSEGLWELVWITDEIAKFYAGREETNREAEAATKKLKEQFLHMEMCMKKIRENLGTPEMF